MRTMRPFMLLITMLALSAFACNLGNGDEGLRLTPTSIGGTPNISLSPEAGVIGSLVTLHVTGFTAGSRVNLLIMPQGATTPTVLAQDLTVAADGGLNFSINIPPQIGTTTITKSTPLALTIQSADGLKQANAVFLAMVGATTPGVATLAATPTQSSVTDGNTGGGQVNNFFITAPAIGSLQGGTQIVVAGSGAAYNNTVNVQIIDGANNVLASSAATIQAGAGTVGVWQTTIGIAQPAQRLDAYIVAYTLTQNGVTAQQASIPIVLAGSGVVAPTAIGGSPVPTAIPLIVTNTPWVITATPH